MHRHPPRRSALVLRALFVAALALAALSPSALTPRPAQAAAIVVDSIADTATTDGACTLREAINNANGDADTTGGDCVAGSGADTITFTSSGTISLGSNLPTIAASSTLTINGGNTITIDGNNARQPFFLGSAASLTLRRLTVTRGSGAGQGGAIEAQGAVANTLTIEDSTFSSNTTTGAGGAIRVTSPNATVSITGSTFSGNGSGSQQGGAIFFSPTGGGTLTIANSTFSGNVVTSVAQRGGALLQGTGTATLTNVTIAGNTAGSGGGIYVFGGTLNLRNSIVAGNTGTTTGPDCVGTVTSQGNNLIGTTAGCTFSATTGDITGVSANLGSLANNGGSTQTMALQSGSPAIDAGANAACTAAPVSNVDQRGQSRPNDGNGDGSAVCDIGAYESAQVAVPTATPTPVPAAPPPTISTVANQTAAPGSTVTVSFTVGDANYSPDQLTLSWGAGSPSLIQSVTFGGTGASRTATILAASGVTGDTAVYLTATNPGAGTATSTFRLNVTHATATPAPSSPTATPPTPIATPPAGLVPPGAPTVVPTTLTTFPPGISAPTGVGVAVAIPPGAPGAIGVVAVGPSGGGGPVTFGIPAPAGGSLPSIGVKLQPVDVLPSGATVPQGRVLTLAIQVDVFDLTTGAVIHHHDPPLSVAFVVPDSARANCAAHPERIVLMHVDDAGRITRLPPSSLDCSTGILLARLSDTSVVAVAETPDGLTIPFRSRLPGIGRAAPLD